MDRLPTTSAQNVYPVLRYRDARAALDFLERAFGLRASVVHEGEGGGIAHAEVTDGTGTIMVGEVGEGEGREGFGPNLIYVAVDDPDALHARAVAAGAEIVMELTDQDYGSRDFAAKDPEGNTWSFGTYRPATP